MSGNVGLICSSINTRAISHGLRDPQNKCKGILPDIKTGIILGIIIGIVVGGIASIFYMEMCKNAEFDDSSYFGFVIGLGQFISIMTATISGAFAPLFFKFVWNTDPASAAGPMETAIQDIVGSTALLALSAVLLSGHPKCPLSEINN